MIDLDAIRVTGAEIVITILVAGLCAWIASMMIDD